MGAGSIQRIRRKICLLYTSDGFSGLIRMEPDPLFYAVSSHPNIRIKIYNPTNLLAPWKSQGRMHDKYVIAVSYTHLDVYKRQILGSFSVFNLILCRTFFVNTLPLELQEAAAVSYTHLR